MMTQQTTDRPTRWTPEQIAHLKAECLAAFDRGDRTTLQDRIGKLRGDLGQQQQQKAGACMAAVQATRESPRFSWRRALVDVLIMVIAVVVSAWIIVSVVGGTG